MLIGTFSTTVAAEPKLRRTIKAHADSLASLAFSRDGKTLATGGHIVIDGNKSQATIKLWNISSGKNILTLNGHTDTVNALAFSPDGKTLASAGSVLDKTVKLWNVSTGKNFATLRGHTFMVMSVSFSPDGRSIASASRDGRIKLWDVASGKNTFTIEVLKQGRMVCGIQP
ncbi:MAG: PD40 domain-containing protein [Planctomycetes bacterium]|nr:PD40 domain-containing protein [Planctomycetota bacterium]